MKFYEVTNDGESTFFTTKEDALREARSIASTTSWGMVTVDKITIAQPDKNLILNILNRHGYVKNRERILTLEEDLKYEEK
jgi:hypothetical protein